MSNKQIWFRLMELLTEGNDMFVYREMLGMDPASWVKADEKGLLSGGVPRTEALYWQKLEEGREKMHAIHAELNDLQTKTANANLIAACRSLLLVCSLSQSQHDQSREPAQVYLLAAARWLLS